MFEKLEKISTAIKTTKEAFYEVGKKELRETISGLFRTHPELKLITWKQYTPYFNDGEPCVFQVYDIYYTCSQNEADEFNKGELDGYDFKAIDSLIEEDIQKLDIFLHYDEELAKAIFGEGQVVCTAKCVSVEDCEHD